MGMKSGTKDGLLPVETSSVRLGDLKISKEISGGQDELGQ